MEDQRREDDTMEPSEDELTNLVTSQAAESQPKNAFHERLGDQSSSSDSFDEDFMSSIDPDQNPHLADQLDDEDLQRQAEADYR